MEGMSAIRGANHMTTEPEGNHGDQASETADACEAVESRSCLLKIVRTKTKCVDDLTSVAVIVSWQRVTVDTARLVAMAEGRNACRGGGQNMLMRMVRRVFCKPRAECDVDSCLPPCAVYGYRISKA